MLHQYSQYLERRAVWSIHLKLEYLHAKPSQTVPIIEYTYLHLQTSIPILVGEIKVSY